MSNRYIIKLIPRDKFFFGQSAPYIELEKDESEFYLRKSAFYPQQTAVLGMLQKQLLLQNEVKFKNQLITKDSLNKAKSLIGSKSFSSKKEEPNDFGIIQKISPVFVSRVDDSSPLIPKFSINNQEIPFAINNNCRVCFDEDTVKSPPLLNNLNLKGDVQTDMVFTEFWVEGDDNVDGEYQSEYLKCFKLLDYELGIQKRKSIDKTVDGGFYKNQFVAFDNKENEHEFCFCFAVELDNIEAIENFRFGNAFVKLGKETNVTNFKMQVIENDTNFNDYFKTPAINSSTQQISLLSDAYLDDKVFDYCDSAVTEGVYFRNVVRNLDEDFTFSKAGKKALSETTLMYKRGSTFYLKSGLTQTQINELNSIFNYDIFIKIGYNHYQIICPANYI